MRKSENKWISVIFGVIMIILGIWLFMHPIATLVAVTALLTAAIAVRGIFAIITFFIHRQKTGISDWYDLVYGIICIVASIFLMVNQGFASSVVLFLLAAWFLFDGLAGIWVSRVISGNMRWVGLVLGVILVIGGIMTAIFPYQGIFTLNWLIGFNFLFDGVQSVFSSFFYDPRSTRR